MKPVLAYIDPGTGAMMWQSLSAVLIGAGFYLRSLLKKLRRK
jgi:hypothetical protein